MYQEKSDERQRDNRVCWCIHPTTRGNFAEPENWIAHRKGSESARYNSHFYCYASRTATTTTMRNRGETKTPLDTRSKGDVLCFRSESSPSLSPSLSSAARSSAYRRASLALARCDDRDSLRHANSVRERRNNNPRPGLFLTLPGKRTCSCNFHQNEQNFAKLSRWREVRAAHTRVSHVCTREFLARHVRVRPTVANRLKKQKKTTKDEMRTRNRDGEKFPAAGDGAPTPTTTTTAATIRF